MKNILITGSGSFIGRSLERYLQEYNAKEGREYYRVTVISQRDPLWETFRLQEYDVIFQASGIAHADVGAVSAEQQELYYRVNCDLAAQTARRAIAAGVKQFIYPSSVIVYGDSAPYGIEKNITDITPAEHLNFYGDSKKKAEQELTRLCREQGEHPEKMKLALLRLPMVYGRGSKGNYPLLAKIAEKTPVFPEAKNRRSMIYIENLCEFIRLLIEEEKEGLFFPQNAEYVSTSQMVELIARAKGRKVRIRKSLDPLVRLSARIPGKIGKLSTKAFGNLTIDKALSPDERHCIYDLAESIQRTERDNQ